MSARLIWVTPNAEAAMAYCARVSSEWQDNPSYTTLLQYCAKNGHWSVFEMASMCVELTTTRMISAQLLRHRSFSFQEFSQRYANAQRFRIQPARRQDTKNRQASHDDLSLDVREWFLEAQSELHEQSLALYEKALAKGIAKECARAVLPLSTETKLYMSGSVRSWIHYLQLRCDEATQLEHREIALAIREIFDEQFPTLRELV